MADFIQQYFCDPITGPAQGYNLVNTLTYAAIMFLIVIYFLYPFLKKQNIKFDYKFVLALLPFVVFGSSLRVLNDMGFFRKTCNILDPNILTFTPGIWFLTAGLVVASIFIAKKLSKNKTDFEKIFGAIGAAIAIPLLLFEFVNFKASWEFFLIGIMVILISLFARFVVSHLKKGFFSDNLNFLALAGQTLDGSATFVATNLQNCGEQHPFSALILGVSPFLFVIIKVVLSLAIIYFIDQEIKDKNINGFTKLVIIVLGFAPGLRDMLTVGVGTCL